MASCPHISPTMYLGTGSISSPQFSSAACGSPVRTQRHRPFDRTLFRPGNRWFLTSAPACHVFIPGIEVGTTVQQEPLVGCLIQNMCLKQNAIASAVHTSPPPGDSSTAASFRKRFPPALYGAEPQTGLPMNSTCRERGQESLP
jgi:hypothetical protein